ncbi:hypothetical protein SKAU_G00194810 [Synaphobranchus kaupii]|uniref:Gypsy retrotransposon integrase-like protein 1 n=1 Tax=Synaphobranchus kaupii TaxID=118154 RepID=A0A9Q1FEH3_SYNKA|nr:hypothetical protein SKAU_G00194810 [Synaphobranchus kaupii]
MEGLKPPSILVLDNANLAKTWKSWKEEFTLYTDLTMAEDAAEMTKVKLFYYLIGESGRELLETLASGNASARKTVSSMMKLFDEHCNPKVNETVERATELSRENSRALQGQTVEEVHALTHATKTKEQDDEKYEDIMTITEVNGDNETVNQVEQSHSQSQQLFAGMMIDKSLVNFQIDCGASCNIIPIQHLNPDTKLEHTEKVLVMYNMTKLCPVGKCKIKIRNPRNSKLYRLEFQVVDQDGRVPILGRKASEAMKLIRVQYENILAIDNIVSTELKPVINEKERDKHMTMENIKREYGDVFTGDGCLEGEYTIEINKEVPPVKLPKRRVPVAMMAPLKEELKDLERRGIIAQVEKSTDWISSMVTVRKPNGKLRICIDPKPLNQALKRSHFPLPTIDDILPELSRAKIFTVCDVKHGFWHVKLQEKSSYLTTFSTPFGRFRWLRMPMGISPAPEIFQRKLMQALEGLPGIHIIADDVLVTGEGATQEEASKDHDEKLKCFLNRCKEQNIKLNVDKMRLRQETVPYIGHLLTAEGLRIDPGKVRAIREMPRPTDVKGVQRLVGMVNYLSKFYVHLTDDCEILRQLTHKDNIWEWTDIQEQAFQRLKDKIADTPVLQYYKQEDELTLQCDASETGLGAALTQGGKPVAFGSRALTPTERGYAQIEKECLAIVYGMQKFHQYTYGRQVTVQSDHKPLENIHKKPLLSAPKRLQRMLLRLQEYNIRIVYVPGRDMLLADTLSRAYLPESTKGDTEAEIETVNMIDYLPITDKRLHAIRSATKEDTKLQRLTEMILTGWPKNKYDIPTDIRHYHSFQDELSFQDGIVFRGERAVIPDDLRADITERVHSSHLGVEGCIRRAKECVYWQGMYDYIKTYITKCDICRAVDPKQQRETLHPHDMAGRAWAKEFQRFSRAWEFEHRTSSPGLAQSNGKAESAVKTAKRLMLKAAAAGQDPYLAMLDHRNTPSQGLDTSPAQRLLCRRTRTLLPTKDTLLEPEITDNTQGLMHNRRRQEKYYNRKARDMDTLKIGDSVRVQPYEPHKVWRAAEVIKPVSHRSYEVKLESGGVLRRNRRHLRHNHGTIATPMTTGTVVHTPRVEVTERGQAGERRAVTTTTRSGRQVIRPHYLTHFTQ